MYNINPVKISIRFSYEKTYKNFILIDRDRAVDEICNEYYLIYIRTHI